MANLVGKWKQTKTENADAFAAASGLSGDALAKLKGSLAPTDTMMEINITGDNYSRKSYHGGKMVQEVTGTIGKPFDRQTLFGNVKTTVQIISDNEARLISDGPGGDVTSKASGNTMTVEWTLNGVTLKRDFARA